MRSATVITSWFALRHLACCLYSRFLASGYLPMWCQAGSSILCFSDIFGASSARWYLAPMLRTLQMLFSRVLLAYLFLLYIVCRKMLTIVLFLEFLFWIVFGRCPIMMVIAASEAMGLFSEWSRIFF